MTLMSPGPEPNFRDPAAQGHSGFGWATKMGLVALAILLLAALFLFIPIPGAGRPGPNPPANVAPAEKARTP